LLQKHKVEFNILCTVNNRNADHPIDVYRFFRDDLDGHYIQLIPIVELNKQGSFQGEIGVTDRSVSSEQWGRFLIEIFDEWVKRDVGQTFVLNFDAALAGWLGIAGTVCTFGSTCGLGLALEHNGDIYSCDHFVQPSHYLGNILESPLIDLVISEKQRKFGLDKRKELPEYCRKCEVLSICNGECPKNRFMKTPDGQAGLNYLCAGYKAFFKHVEKPMLIMADLIRRGRLAKEVMIILKEEGRDSENKFLKIGRNEPCPCGSRKKFKKCHGLLGFEKVI
jgi:uncharacterized protein